MKTPEQQPGPHQHHERQRDLRDNQPLAQSGPSAGRAAGRVLERIVQIGTPGLPRGGQSEKNTRQHRDHRRKSQHARIKPDLCRARNAVAAHGQNQPHPAVSEQQTERAAGERQQHAFGEQLTDDPPPACAQRRAHGHFFLSPRRAREQQVRHVRAGDQQHQPHRAQQSP